jgi:hypothetical protein
MWLWIGFRIVVVKARSGSLWGKGRGKWKRYKEYHIVGGVHSVGKGYGAFCEEMQNIG